MNDELKHNEKQLAKSGQHIKAAKLLQVRLNIDSAKALGLIDEYCYQNNFKTSDEME